MKKTLLKTVTITIILLAPLVFTFSGCTGEQITGGADAGTEINLKAGQFRESWPEIEAALIAAGLDPNDFDTVNKFIAKAEIWQPRFQQILDAAAGGEYTGEKELENLLAAAKVINLATSQWNPYAPAIAKSLEMLPWLLSAAGGLLTLIFGKKNSDRKKALNEIVDGIEDYKKTGVEATVKNLRKTQNSAQSEKTRAMVARRRRETAA